MSCPFLRHPIPLCSASKQEYTTGCIPLLYIESGLYMFLMLNWYVTWPSFVIPVSSGPRPYLNNVLSPRALKTSISKQVFQNRYFKTGISKQVFPGIVLVMSGQPSKKMKKKNNMLALHATSNITRACMFKWPTSSTNNTCVMDNSFTYLVQQFLLRRVLREPQTGGGFHAGVVAGERGVPEKWKCFNN
jgi:hypothetical protein